MPTYAYQCPKCDTVLELQMTVSQYEKAVAPFCMEAGCDGQPEMKRVLSAPAVHFKGSGWTPKHYT